MNWRRASLSDSLHLLLPLVDKPKTKVSSLLYCKRLQTLRVFNLWHRSLKTQQIFKTSIYPRMCVCALFHTNNVLRVHWKQLNALKERAIKHNCGHVRAHKAHTGSIKWCKTANVAKIDPRVVNVWVLSHYVVYSVQSRCRLVMMDGFILGFKLEKLICHQTQGEIPH